MGLSLADTTKIASGLLDFASALPAEYATGGLLKLGQVFKGARLMNRGDQARAVAKATSGIYMGTTGDSVSNSGVAQTLIDVTNTSNVKVKFYVDTLNSTTTVYGSSTATLTGFTFIRLGDT